jgi:uncharacterized membrane protein YfcA
LHEEGGMHAESDVYLFAVSIGASAFGGALGMASGIFIVPFLTLFEGVSIHSAVACSIVSVIACSCASAAPFLRGGLTNIRVAIVLETATTLGALTACFWRASYPCRSSKSSSPRSCLFRPCR